MALCLWRGRIAEISRSSPVPDLGHILQVLANIVLIFIQPDANISLAGCGVNDDWNRWYLRARQQWLFEVIAPAAYKLRAVRYVAFQWPLDMSS
jgi:hypothetical protein